MIQKTLVDTEEAAHAILEYIGSEDFDKAAHAILEYIGSEDFDKAEKAIEDNGRAGLMSGLALSISVILSKCTKYIYTVQDAPADQSEEAAPDV